MREADVAMYAAKANGKNRVERYDSVQNDMTMARHQFRVDLGAAADRGELVLDYQPVVTWRPACSSAWRRWFAGSTRPAASCPVGVHLRRRGDRRHQRHRRLEAGDGRPPGAALAESLRAARALDVRERFGVSAGRGRLRRLCQVRSRHHRGPGRRLVLEVTESILAEAGGDASGVLASCGWGCE